MERRRSIFRVSVTGIVVNVLLVGFKAMLGAATGSVAIIMDAVNNLSDALSSAITILGTYLAGKAPDRKHPYGHGRIEYITGAVISLIVLTAGVGAFLESVRKIIEPVKAVYTTLSLVLIAAPVGVKLLLGRYYRSRGRSLNCQALIASGTDALFDALVSLSTLAAAAVSLVWDVSLEGWLGAFISLLMVRSGIRLLSDGLSSIIGVRIDSELAHNLKSLICSHEQVLGAYDLTLHRYGPEHLIGSVHIEVPDDMTAREIDSLTRHLTEDVFNSFGIVLTVGIYASNTCDSDVAAMKARVQELVARRPEILQMHGFYADRERSLVSFDITFEYGTQDRYAVRDQLTDQLRREFPDYTFAVVLDNDVSD